MFRIPLLISTLMVSTAGATWTASLDGWHLAGSAPDAYQMEPDTETFHTGGSSAHLYSTENRVKGFGTIMQAFDADPYQGERVRLTAWVKSQDVGSWSGLWMRVDEGDRSVSFDNMSSRPITGYSAGLLLGTGCVAQAAPSPGADPPGASARAKGGSPGPHPSTSVPGGHSAPASDPARPGSPSL